MKTYKFRYAIFNFGTLCYRKQDHSLFMAHEIKKICDELKIEYIFKASFDKANRTKLKNFRGLNSIEDFRSLQINSNKIGVKVCGLDS